MAKKTNKSQVRGLFSWLSERGRKAFVATAGAVAVAVAVATVGLTAAAAEGVVIDNANYPDGTTAMADPSTVMGFRTFPTGSEATSYDTTEYAGRLWTDKSVYVPTGGQDGNTVTVPLTNENHTVENPDTQSQPSYGAGRVEVDKTESGIFLTSISALSSSLTTELVEPQPLDIVLVLDLSGSMRTTTAYSEVTSMPNGNFASNDPNDTNNDRRYFVFEDGIYKQARATGTDSGARYYSRVDNGNYDRYYYTSDASLFGTPVNGNDRYRYVQLYRKDKESRTELLQAATAEFLETIAANNTALADAGYTTDAMSQISMVYFSTYYRGQSTWPTEPFYPSGRMTEATGQWVAAHTGISTPFTIYTNDGSEGTANVSYGTTIVNRPITPTNATAADLGLRLAQAVFEEGRVTIPGNYANASMGGTRDGISLAGARENAQQVVIFFTDGNPKHGGGQAPQDFSGLIAKQTIEVAEELKDGGAIIYAVAMIDTADPDDMTQNINIYLNGVSSNYSGANVSTATDDKFYGTDLPSARSWTMDLDTWTGSNQGYYMVVGGDTSISDAFASIAADITSGGSGEATATGRDGNTSLTITDYLGDYMEFKGIDGILYGVDAESTTFYAPGTQGAWHVQAQAQRDDRSATESVYTMNAVVPSSLLSARHEDGEGNVTVDNTNLNLITIQVTRSTDPKTGDTVTIKIPPELVPSLRYDVTQKLSGGSITTAVTRADADPIRIFYSVGPKADTLANVISQLEEQALRSANATNESDRQTSAYREFIANAAAYGTDGYYNLYSNRPTYDGYTVTQAPQGEAKVDMVLSETTPYYFYVDEPLYVLVSGSYQKATTDNCDLATDTLYIRNCVWTVGSDVADPSTYVAWDGTTPVAGDDDVYYIPEHTYRTDDTVANVSAAKTDNTTETATNAFVSSFTGAQDNLGNYIATQYLGNNGLLHIPVYGTLAVMKDFEAGPGFSLPTNPAPEATFTITLQDAEGHALTQASTYRALIRDAEGHPVDPTSHATANDADDVKFYVSNGSTFTLRDGETIKVTNLPDGATYRVEEAGMEGYQATVTNNEGTVETFDRGDSSSTKAAA